ncbi:MAG: hydantoinase/oxoprolinase family protein, partial [Rhodobacteraceae bacterium]|nr:hydantoinase/oxoprolinase family protein [Paracoccaceae bacterium]
MKKRSRLGVDIGGTFTDVVLEHQGKLYSNKVLTTFDIPEDAIIEGVKGVCQKSGILPSEIEQIIHGTTLATNSLIERRGAKIALITTEGFRDVIEMRTESRFEQYDLNLVLPTPLVPRNCRYTLNERVDSKGSILKELRQEDVDQLIDVIQVANFESVAVGFIHSYLNPSHERMLEKSLKERLPHVSVSLSSAVSPQMREYERFNTVCANAFVKPMMKSYLDRLTSRLLEQEINCPVFLMHSGGGIISLDSATEFPVRLIESGPAGGAIFAAKIAEKHGLDKVLSFDMGGTTAKICLIKDKSPKTARVFEVARTYRFKKGSGMPISIPVIDMVEIGAGGGSLANIDSMNQIRVGPESASSKPGPACYDLGGNRPAVTDADLLLGRLDGDNFAGGSITLNVEKSKVALRKEIGEALSMEPIESAFGVSEVVDENMANAARMHAVENGEDLAEFTMIAFGGAAPLHAARLCQKLGIKEFIVAP